MIPKKATRQQTKEHNRDLVLKTIFDYETISRAEIARITNLTRTTVSNTITFLIGFLSNHFTRCWPREPVPPVINIVLFCK